MKTTQCSLLFLLKDDEILLAMKKRGFGEGKWNGVGGKLELNESFEQAARRECEEEIVVTPHQLTYVAQHVFEYQYKVPEIINVRVFFSRKWEGTPTETEEMAPKWFEINDIPYKRMWADDQYWLPLILNGKKLRAIFTFDLNDKVIQHEVTEVETL